MLQTDVENDGFGDILTLHVLRAGGVKSLIDNTDDAENQEKLISPGDYVAFFYDNSDSDDANDVTADHLKILKASAVSIQSSN